jgi:hypothetical protein
LLLQRLDLALDEIVELIERLLDVPRYLKIHGDHRRRDPSATGKRHNPRISKAAEGGYPTVVSAQ